MTVPGGSGEDASIASGTSSSCAAPGKQAHRTGRSQGGRCGLQPYRAMGPTGIALAADTAWPRPTRWPLRGNPCPNADFRFNVALAAKPAVGGRASEQQSIRSSPQRDSAQVPDALRRSRWLAAGVEQTATEQTMGGVPRQLGSPRVLGVRSIALISVAAVLTLRNMPSVAEYGWSSIAYYLLGALFFFIPLSLVAAELGTGWPKAGGLYAWVKEAFGERSGFLAVWFEWVENIPYFPTVLAFCAATFAYVIEPGLANDKTYLVIAMLTIFWGLTAANFFGMRWSARLDNPGVILGTILPAAVLIVLGVYWLSAGRHNQIPFHASKLAPDLGTVNNMVFFVAVLLSYAGIEMAGFHAKEMRSPARDYPRAIFVAVVLIVGISILATL